MGSQRNQQMIAIVDAGNAVERMIDVTFEHERLSASQIRLLMATEESPAITPKHLAVALCQASHSISGLLNRLEDKGLIERHRDRSDRRVVHISLTDDGRELVELIKPKLWGIERRVARVVGDAFSGGIEGVRDALAAEAWPGWAADDV